MAAVRAVKNGNWSDTTVWNTGTLPTTADDVYSNTFTVAVDTSFQVLSLRNTSGTSITAGGTFNFNSGSISASLTSATGIVKDGNAANLLTITAGSGTVIISAPSTTIQNFPAASNTQTINHTGACDFIITGSTFIGGDNNPTYAINKSSIGLLSILGNIIGSSAAATTPSIIVSAGSTIIRGSVVGGSNAGGITCRAITQTAGSLTIIGNVTGGSGNNSHNAIEFSGAFLTVTGSVTGGSTSVGINISSAATVNISGSVTGTAVVGISYTGAGSLTVSGSCTAGSISPAVISTNASATNIFTGPFTNTNNTMAVQCVDMVLTQDASTFWNFGNITLFSPERLAFYPSASDIRQGTTYADGTVSGSLAMPPPTAVIAGTPTDNTTGSAVLTPTQLQDAVWGRDLAQMTETGSIGYRLAKSATTDSTGNQIASYLI